MTKPTQNGKEGKVYWQDDNLIHVDGEWVFLGERMATEVEIVMRKHNELNLEKDKEFSWSAPLCPACYMLIAYNMLVGLAQRTGQDIEELRSSMIELFTHMDAQNPHATAINVICPLDVEKDWEETG